MLKPALLSLTLLGATGLVFYSTHMDADSDIASTPLAISKDSALPTVDTEVTVTPSPIVETVSVAPINTTASSAIPYNLDQLHQQYGITFHLPDTFTLPTTLNTQPTHEVASVLRTLFSGYDYYLRYKSNSQYPDQVWVYPAGSYPPERLPDTTVDVDTSPPQTGNARTAWSTLLDENTSDITAFDMALQSLNESAMYDAMNYAAETRMYEAQTSLFTLATGEARPEVRAMAFDSYLMLTEDNPTERYQLAYLLSSDSDEGIREYATNYLSAVNTLNEEDSLQQ